jgi:hypothetical protein
MDDMDDLDELQCLQELQDERFGTLDKIAERVAVHDDRGYGKLSTSEAMYVALAANRVDLLGGETVVGALDRIGEDWTRALIARWRYVPHPSLWAKSRGASAP